MKFISLKKERANAFIAVTTCFKLRRGFPCATDMPTLFASFKFSNDSYLFKRGSIEYNAAQK